MQATRTDVMCTALSIEGIQIFAVNNQHLEQCPEIPL
jgi:hypothetical protein